jgi:tetratricopeptide (TPR) repeat protein
MRGCNMTDEIRPCLSPSEILAYLDGALSADGKAEIDRHVDACRLCEEAIEGVAGLEWREGFLRSTDALLAKVRARTARAAATARAAHRRPLPFRHAPQLLALAATFVVGLGTAIVLTRERPGEELFRRSFEPYPSTRPIVRGARVAGSPGALALYEASDYRGALAGLEDALRRDPDDSVARFYAGVCRLALGRAREATQDLEQVLALGNEDLRQPAEWYLALARLRANDLAGARRQLEGIASAEGFYRERARTLLPELDRRDKRH